MMTAMTHVVKTSQVTGKRCLSSTRGHVFLKKRSPATSMVMGKNRRENYIFRLMFKVLIIKGFYMQCNIGQFTRLIYSILLRRVRVHGRR